jgi:hypothetical protein
MPLSPANATRARWFLGLVAAAAGLVALLATDQTAQWTRYDVLSNVTADMLDANIGRDMKTFMAVSGIKAGMAIMTGSTIEAGVGASLEFEVGDAIQPVYDYVDFVWKMLLYALMVLGFYKLLLETGILAIGIKIAGIGLLMWGLSAFVAPRREPLRRWGRAFVLFGLLIACVVPASLWGTQQLSQSYTERLKAKQYTQIEQFQREFDRFRNGAVALKDKLSVFKPAESFDEVKVAFARMSDSLMASSRASLMAFLYYILILLFELLFLPFLSAFMLYKFLQAALDELFGTGMARRRATAEAEAEARV